MAPAVGAYVLSHEEPLGWVVVEAVAQVHL